MINEGYYKKFCRDDISLIENYHLAVKSNEKWDLHHKDEIKILPSGIKVIRSKLDLVENGRYENCPANELIFLTHSEHMSLHRQNEWESEEKRKIKIEGIHESLNTRSCKTKTDKDKHYTNYRREWQRKFREAHPNYYRDLQRKRKNEKV